MNIPIYFKSGVIAMCFMFFFTGINAQSEDYGVWLDLSVNKKVKSGVLSFFGEFYTKENSRTIERTGIGLSANYPLIANIKMDAGYLLLNYNNPIYRDIRNRYFSSVVMKWHFFDFELCGRERIQLTRKQGVETKTINDLYWRNRIKLNYRKENWRIFPSAAIETFYSFGKSGTYEFDEVRYSLAANYQVSKTNDIAFYSLWSDYIDMDFYVIGLEYNMSF